MGWMHLKEDFYSILQWQKVPECSGRNSYIRKEHLESSKIHNTTFFFSFLLFLYLFIGIIFQAAQFVKMRMLSSNIFSFKIIGPSLDSRIHFFNHPRLFKCNLIKTSLLLMELFRKKKMLFHFNFRSSVFFSFRVI